MFVYIGKKIYLPFSVVKKARAFYWIHSERTFKKANSLNARFRW